MSIIKHFCVLVYGEVNILFYYSSANLGVQVKLSYKTCNVLAVGKSNILLFICNELEFLLLAGLFSQV